MPLLRRLLLSALVVVAASALCVCAALASVRPLVAKAHHPRLTILHHALAPVTRLAPGDHAQRTLELRYRGSGRFAAVVLRVKGLSNSPLTSSSAVALHLKIERCSGTWKRSSRTRTYSCNGKRSVVLSPLALGSSKPFTLRHLSPRAGRTDRLLLTIGLPQQAGNALQHRLAKLVYAFTGA